MIAWSEWIEAMQYNTYIMQRNICSICTDETDADGQRNQHTIRQAHPHSTHTQHMNVETRSNPIYISKLNWKCIFDYHPIEQDKSISANRDNPMQIHCIGICHLMMTYMRMYQFQFNVCKSGGVKVYKVRYYNDI